MPSFTWNGGNGDYLDPTQWTPGDVPLYGADTLAAITAGNVSLSGAEPNGITLSFGGPPAAYQAGPALILNNAAFGPQMALDVSYDATLDIEGDDTNFGNIAIGSPTVYKIASIGTRSNGQFNQYGTLSVGAAALLSIDANTVVNNGGLIDVVGGHVSVNDTITGAGTIDIASPGSELDMNAGVEPGQTIRLQQGLLAVNNEATFNATIAGFTDSAASLRLGGIQFDAATYAQDASGEHLVLSNGGATVGEIQLADTPAVQYTVAQDGTATIITPASPVYTNGSIPGTITTGVVTVRSAEPNGQTVILGRSGFPGQSGAPNLVLDNAALGPDLTLAIGSPATVGTQIASLTVQGYDTVYGAIDVAPSTGAQPPGNSQLTININPGSQLNLVGAINVASSSPSLSFGGSLVIQGPGTLNNDGLIYLGAGSSLEDLDNSQITGFGTLKIDGGNAHIPGVASTQTVDLLGGTINPFLGSFQGNIKDWNSKGELTYNGYVSSVQFNQTSAAGGDLQIFAFGKQIGDLNLLGTYATSDFTVVHGHTSSGITLGGTFPPLV